MSFATRLSRIWNAVVSKADEGSVRPGSWNLPVSGGWLSQGPPGYGESLNWWQLGGQISGYSRMAMIEACVSAYAQTMAMCPGDHWRKQPNGGRLRVTNSALSRILRNFNDYQTPSDFMLNLVRSLYLDGNAYAMALRNDRYEIDELHMMDPRQSGPMVAPSTGDIFYHLGGNSVIDHRGDELPHHLQLGRNEQWLVPARDVLHIRLNCYERTQWPFPLVGETPLVAAFGDIATYEKIKDQQNKLYDNQARPSAVITTDLELDKDQVQALRDRWNEQAKGLHAGGVPILTHGLKVMPWAQAAPNKDMQVAEMLQLAQDQIALVYRVPLAILGVKGASGGTTEQLMGFWLASGLGFCMNHVEESFDKLFELKGQPSEYTEFNTEALLRTDQKSRIDMLVRAVQGGIYSPNEARAVEDLPAVEYGDEPRVQQQVVPLSAAANIPEAGGPPGFEAGGGEGEGASGGEHPAGIAGSGAAGKRPIVPGAPTTPAAPAAAGAQITGSKQLLLPPSRSAQLAARRRAREFHYHDLNSRAAKIERFYRD